MRCRSYGAGAFKSVDKRRVPLQDFPLEKQQRAQRDRSSTLSRSREIAAGQPPFDLFVGALVK